MLPVSRASIFRVLLSLSKCIDGVEETNQRHTYPVEIFSSTLIHLLLCHILPRSAGLFSSPAIAPILLDGKEVGVVQAQRGKRCTTTSRVQGSNEQAAAGQELGAARRRARRQ